MFVRVRICVYVCKCVSSYELRCIHTSHARCTCGEGGGYVSRCACGEGERYLCDETNIFFSAIRVRVCMCVCVYVFCAYVRAGVQVWVCMNVCEHVLGCGCACMACVRV